MHRGRTRDVPMRLSMARAPGFVRPDGCCSNHLAEQRSMRPTGVPPASAEWRSCGCGCDGQNVTPHCDAVPSGRIHRSGGRERSNPVPFEPAWRGRVRTDEIHCASALPDPAISPHLAGSGSNRSTRHVSQKEVSLRTRSRRLSQRCCWGGPGAVAAPCDR